MDCKCSGADNLGNGRYCSFAGIGLGKKGPNNIRASRHSLLTASGGNPVLMVVTCREKQRGRVGWWEKAKNRMKGRTKD